MNDITDILRHRHGLGLTRDQIAAAVGVSSGTVSHVLERASAAGLTWPLPEDLDDDALRARLYPSCTRDSGHAQPDWDAVIEELEKPRKRRRTRLTRRQLWKEYRDEAVARGGIAEARHGRRSILIASQIPVENWPGVIGEPTIADAVLDRIVHNAYRIDLKGESQRKRNRPPPLQSGNDK